MKVKARRNFDYYPNGIDKREVKRDEVLEIRDDIAEGLIDSRHVEEHKGAASDADVAKTMTPAEIHAAAQDNSAAGGDLSVDTTMGHDKWVKAAQVDLAGQAVSTQESGEPAYAPLLAEAAQEAQKDEADSEDEKGSKARRGRAAK